MIVSQKFQELKSKGEFEVRKKAGRIVQGMEPSQKEHASRGPEVGGE